MGFLLLNYALEIEEGTNIAQKNQKGGIMRKLFLCSWIFVFCFWGIVGAETLHLTTEDYPPFNMRVSGQSTGGSSDPLSGISVEIVKEMFKRAGMDFSLEIYPWKRAYNMALNQADYGVFSTTRTEEREKLFQWVGPLVENDWVLFAKKGGGIKVGSLDEARKYKVGGYSGDAVSLFLENDHGFKLDLVTSDFLNAKKLDVGRIDLWATGKLIAPYLAKQEKTTGVEELFTFKKTQMYLALNKAIPESTIIKLNKMLEEMRKDGAIESIYAKYR